MVPDALSSVLARYPAIIRPLSEPVPLGNCGGWSGAQLWRFGSGKGPLVARAWPPEGPDADRLREIHRWISRAAGIGFVPVPEPDRSGETVQEFGGLLWEVAPWMPGAADEGRPPPRGRLRAGFRALALFHQALATESTVGPAASLRSRLCELEALLLGGFDALAEAIARDPAGPHREAAARWLDLARRLAPRLLGPLREAAARPCRVQPCLRDARPEHLLFEGDRVAGLVDFGAMGIDPVAADLSRLLSEWLGGDRLARAEALDAYASARPLEVAETTLIATFEASAALLGPGHWVRWHFVEGRRFRDPVAVGRGLDRGLERLARLVAEGAFRG